MSSSSSSEILWNPPYDSELRKSSFLVATFNLVATIVGGGVLSLPLAFHNCGIGGAIILMIFAAIITAKSLRLLCFSARTIGANSYGNVGWYAFGPIMETIVSALLAIFLLFVLVAYMVLLRDIATPIVQLIHPELSGNFILACILLFLSPFFVQRTLHALRFNCYVGLASVMLLCIALLHHALVRKDISDTLTPLQLGPKSLGDVLFAFPIITLSFLSSFNVLPIQNALQNPTPERIHAVIDTAVFLCFLVMLSLGLGGYAYARDKTQGNILLNCNSSEDNKDWIMILGRIGFGITIMFAMGMMIIPCRDCCFQVLNQLDPDPIVVENSSSSNSDDGNTECYCGEQSTLLTSFPNSSSNLDQQLVSKRRESQLFWHYGITLVIVLITYFGAALAPGVAIVWSLCGSSMAFAISFFLPAIFYAKLHTSINKGTDCLVWFLIIFSIIELFFVQDKQFFRFYRADQYHKH
jgi:amino acid permease